jgi:DNA polymerase III epsilon subunit-like protein
MKVFWCDTETTGLNPMDSGPFELAFLVYDGGNFVESNVFHLNPLNDEVIIHPGALAVNGVSEETIKSYRPAKEVVPEMIEFFKKHCPPEKLIFAGYKCPFDYGQIGGLLFREGFTIGDYFNGRLIDVLDLVKRAKEMNLLEATRNNKLETMTKSLCIEHDSAHSALSDIKATKLLYEAIYLKLRRKGK